LDDVLAIFRSRSPCDSSEEGKAVKRVRLVPVNDQDVNPPNPGKAEFTSSSGKV